MLTLVCCRRKLSLTDITAALKQRHIPYAKVAYRFLSAAGYINFGIAPALKPDLQQQDKGTVIVVGAGLAGQVIWLTHPAKTICIPCCCNAEHSQTIVTKSWSSDSCRACHAHSGRLLIQLVLSIWLSLPCEVCIFASDDKSTNKATACVTFRLGMCTGAAEAWL